MNTTAPVPGREWVAGWPRLAATVRPDGTGSLTINGTERPCAAKNVETLRTAKNVETLRTGMIARCTGLATRLRRPVRLTVVDGEHTWNLAIRHEGIVHLIDEHGTIPPPDGLTVHTGPCRRCQQPQPVTAHHCAVCGTTEPHQVETDPTEHEINTE